MDLSSLPYIRRIVFTDDERALLLEAYPRWLSTFKKPSVPHLVGGDSGATRPMGDIDVVRHHSIHRILDKGLRDGTKAVVAMTDEDCLALSELVMQDIAGYYDFQMSLEALMDAVGVEFFPIDDANQKVRFNIISKLHG